ncbi:MAG: hypothetical protein HY811_02715 [Planctomycetes bacterium]|nr:hypothetical protein [Planctomycetota bacterium]
MVTQRQNIPKDPSQDEVEIAEGSLAEQLVTQKIDFGAWLQSTINTMGIPLLISLFVHVFGIVILAALIVAEPVVKTEEIKTIKLPPPVEEKQLDMELPRDVIENNKPPKDDQVSETDPVWKDAEESDHNETADDEDFNESKGDSYDFVSDKPLKGAGVYDMMGVGGGAGGRYGGPRGGRRNLAAKGGGGRNESAVMAGLYWLARHQNPDGSWGATAFQNQCKGGRCSGTGQTEFDVGLTGLALLAFTGANYSPGSIGPRDTFGGIKFGDTVRKAAMYLKGIQKANGMYGENSMLKFMYNQGTCSYGMSDLYCVMKDKGEPAVNVFKDTALKGVQCIIDSQNDGKAWRYKPKDGDNDMSVSGWCMMALKTAEEGGLIKVPQTVWDGVKAHLDDVTDLGYGGVGYRERGNVAILGSEKEKWDSGQLYTPPSLTAVGIMCRIFMGQNRKDAVIANSAAMLVEGGNLPKWDANQYGKIDYYYWFYGSYALNQFDGPKGSCWGKWEKEMLPVVIKSQKTKSDGCANGSWDPIDRWSPEVGRIYSTAIAILTLEVYYRIRIVEGH